MVESLRIWFLASEVTPFAKTGGLADVAGALPGALRKLGMDVRVGLPYYRAIREQNLDTDMPRAYHNDDNNNSRISDRYVEDASFLKIQTVTLGYTLPESIVKKIKAKNLRVYVSGKNLYTFTKYTGYEPEHGPLQTNGKPNTLLSGVDIGNYPIPRSVVFGINLDF